MLYIGLDDTDSPTSRGTGHLAREMAAHLEGQLPVFGVTRHQLVSDARVRMTAKNSANVVHVALDSAALTAEELGPLADWVKGFVSGASQAGADPGVCLALDAPQELAEFGYRAQRMLVTAAEARALAERHGLILEALGGDGSGIIGALAAVALAASGNDGRFTQVGRVRDLTGTCRVPELHAAGIAEVQTLVGQAVCEGHVDTGDKLRPALIGGEVVLLVEPTDGGWRAVRRD